jgi:L-asparaginase/Glu-tRNA(Gln) amidotransferase subunit D
MVCLNDTINGARDVAKTNTALADAFRSPELGYMGYIQDGRPHIYNTSTRRHTYHSEFDMTDVHTLPRVDIVYGYAGGGAVQVDALTADGTRGIVFAGPGNGSLSQTAKEALIRARTRGVLIVRSSRVGSGRVARNGEADDDALDFIAGDNLSPQKARILLMLALTKTTDTAEIQRMFDQY